jgi:hypothetical protein
MISKPLRSGLDVAVIGVTLSSLLVAFALVGTNRYGDNQNNYAMLRSWQEMVANGAYVPSRFQGNLLSELLIGYLAAVAGPIGSNALSLALSVLSLAMAYALLRKVASDRLKIGLALSTVAINPYWVKASITSMDYTHPIPFFLAGILLTQRRIPIIAAICFAIAGGMRISYVPLGLAALLAATFFEAHRSQKQVLIQAFVAYLVILCLIYFPAFLSAHLRFTFLGSARPTENGIGGLLARWAYKQLYLYGLLGTVIVWASVSYPFTRVNNDKRKLVGVERTYYRICLALAAFHLLLFLYIPVRVEYLLPILLAMAGVFVVTDVPRTLLVALILAEGLYWFSSIDLLEVRRTESAACAAIHGVGARFAPHVSQGVLVGELTGQTDELLCLPKGLLQQPKNIRDRLPVPVRPE